MAAKIPKGATLVGPIPGTKSPKRAVQKFKDGVRSDKTLAWYGVTEGSHTQLALNHLLIK